MLKVCRRKLYRCRSGDQSTVIGEQGTIKDSTKVKRLNVYKASSSVV